MPGFDEAHVLALAALVSSDGGQDPVDGGIRATAATKSVSDAPKLIKFVPFDPATKMSEATVQDPGSVAQRVVKGAFAAVVGLAPPSSTRQPRRRSLRTRASACWRSPPDRRRR